MSLQYIINSAVSVEVNRSKLVAQSISRSGKVLTASRNWVNPWRFVVEPQPVWLHSNYRSIFEPIINGDKYVEHTIKLGQGGQAWVTEYMGNAPTTNGVLDTLTVTSASGTSMVVNTTGMTNGVVIVKAGDIIQPVGHRYPYVATSTVTVSGNSATITLHRGFIPTATSISGVALRVGTDCEFTVQVTKMPTTKFTSGKLVEFTTNFDLIEVVL
jgi:hypothetical protein